VREGLIGLPLIVSLKLYRNDSRRESLKSIPTCDRSPMRVDAILAEGGGRPCAAETAISSLEKCSTDSPVPR
jgi:hypothetical protein